MKLFKYFIFISLFIFSTSLYAAKEITISGSSIVSERILLKEALNLEKPALYKFWTWFDSYLIDEKNILTIKSDITRYYRKLGYFNIDVKVIKNKDSVVVTVTENSLVAINNIIFDLDLISFIPFKKGELFEPSKFTQTKKEILRYYNEQGYCFSSLDAKAKVDLEEDVVNLEFYLDKKALCKIDSIVVMGVDDTKKNIVLTHIELKKGAVFDIRNIENSYKMLQSYGAFSQIDIDYKHNQTSELEVIIKLNNNAQPHLAKVGIGFSSDTGPRIVGSWRHQNFHDKMKILELNARAALIEQELSATYIQRNFLDVNSWWLNVLDFNQFIGFKHKDYSSYSSDSYAIKPSVEKLEYVREFKTGVIIEENIITQHAITSKALKSTIRVDTTNFFIVSPFVSLAYDYRDSKLRPTRGYYVQNYLEYGELTLGSQVRYLKLEETLSYARKMYGFLLGTKFKIGVINEYVGELPFSKRFYAGGAFSNRAYEYEGLNPSDTRSSGTGGRSLIDTSFNLLHPIYENFDILTFVDMTVLNENELSFTGPVVFGLGVGLSYNTVVGPVNTSIGFDPNKPGQYAVHFQVGYTF